MLAEPVGLRIAIQPVFPAGIGGDTAARDPAGRVHDDGADRIGPEVDADDEIAFHAFPSRPQKMSYR
jgi:hypothetical protein